MPIKIIAGDFKNFVLKSTIETEITRPILARVKKSLFDILSPNLKNANFLDLFCGTGAIGIEALSRGAAKATFVDKDKKGCKCTTENIRLCKVTEKANLFCMDVFDFLGNFASEKFDLIFAGPPYPFNFVNKILEALVNSNILHDETIIIIQHEKREKVLECVNNVSKNKKLLKFREKVYGHTILSFWKIESQEIK